MEACRAHFRRKQDILDTSMAVDRGLHNTNRGFEVSNNGSQCQRNTDQTEVESS